jgi:hypothetical protein
VGGFFELWSEERRGVSSSGEDSTERVTADITGGGFEK